MIEKSFLVGDDVPADYDIKLLVVLITHMTQALIILTR